VDSTALLLFIQGGCVGGPKGHQQATKGWQSQAGEALEQLEGSTTEQLEGLLKFVVA
jgi:hypothetical protein